MKNHRCYGRMHPDQDIYRFLPRQAAAWQHCARIIRMYVCSILHQCHCFEGRRSYRCSPKRSTCWRIALWFRDVAPAGGRSRNRRSHAAKLGKSQGPESAWRSLLPTRHDSTPHCRPGRHLGALSAHHTPPLPPQSGRSAAHGASVLVLPRLRGEAPWCVGPRRVPHVDSFPRGHHRRVRRVPKVLADLSPLPSLVHQGLSRVA